jgi:FixJ family two-component response regulator
MSSDAIVHIVDDDPAARESVAAVVRSRGLKVQEYDSAEQFLKVERPSGPGCLLLDIRMPGMSGLELQTSLKAAGVRLPTVVITGFGDVATAVKAMQNGAITFLEKPCEQQQLWDALELALAQANQQQASTLRRQELEQRFASLTESERTVLIRVMDGQPNKRIATEMDIGLRTVELRRSNIMRKTGATSLSELIRLAIEAGFPDAVPAGAAQEIAEAAV